MKRFLKWLGRQLSPATNSLDENLHPENGRIRPVPVRVKPPAARPRPQPPAPRTVTPETIELSTESAGIIADGGPGKNVLVQPQFLQEDTGTHETLMIVDETIPESEGKEAQFDPYNTGRFDRSKSWDGPSRK